MSNFMGKENILLQDIAWHSSENKTFALNKMFQWITSKFAIFYVHIVFVFHFSFWAQKRPGKSKVELEWKKNIAFRRNISLSTKIIFSGEYCWYSLWLIRRTLEVQKFWIHQQLQKGPYYYSLPWKLRHAAHARESR